jgi:hypothetical protein
MIAIEKGNRRIFLDKNKKGTPSWLFPFLRVIGRLAVP